MRAIRVVPVLAVMLAAPAPGADFELAHSGPESSEALQGRQLGIAESNIQGEFLRVRLTLAVSSGEPMPGEALAVFADQRGRIADLAGRAVFSISATTPTACGR